MVNAADVVIIVIIVTNGSLPSRHTPCFADAADRLSPHYHEGVTRHVSSCHRDVMRATAQSSCERWHQRQIWLI